MNTVPVTGRILPEVAYHLSFKRPKSGMASDNPDTHSADQRTRRLR
jgi:hypothetical protein